MWRRPHVRCRLTHRSCEAFDAHLGAGSPCHKQGEGHSITASSCKAIVDCGHLWLVWRWCWQSLVDFPGLGLTRVVLPTANGLPVRSSSTNARWRVCVWALWWVSEGGGHTETEEVAWPHRRRDIKAHIVISTFV